MTYDARVADTKKSPSTESVVKPTSLTGKQDGVGQKPFAVFDIDGTIVRTALFLQIVDELVAAKQLPASAKIRLDAKLELYQTRQHTAAFNDYTHEAVDVLFAELPKISVNDYRAAVDKVVARSWEHIYVYTKNLIKKLKSDGYFLIAISGSENYAVEQFTKHYNFDVAVGEIYEQKADFFTGEVKTVVFKKDEFLKDVVDKYNLTYAKSYAIGDSQSDAKMLELVENPIAFNPESRLFDIAKQNDWKIVIERKNVIYELKKNNGVYNLK